MQKLKLRRVLFQKFTITSRKNGWVEITGYCRPKPRQKPTEPPEVMHWMVEPFPGLVDSRLFPGLIYNMFQMVGRYEDREARITESAFRLLWLLENHVGEAGRDDALSLCWGSEATVSALRHAIEAANKFFIDTGIPCVIEGKYGKIFVAP